MPKSRRNVTLFIKVKCDTIDPFYDDDMELQAEVATFVETVLCGRTRDAKSYILSDATCWTEANLRMDVIDGFALKLRRPVTTTVSRSRKQRTPK